MIVDHCTNKFGYKKTKVGWIPNEWECLPLCDIAVVQTGIAKNKKNDKKSNIKLPYLRVANVQDGFLDLRKMYEIGIEESKINRFLLKEDDVLFTEGGDFDKLGRGTLWEGQIDKCLHQNHIFAVRCNQKLIVPYFLSSLASSALGRRYFLISSKQSTNLASINSTQLKAFPIPLPSLSEQFKISEIFSIWDTAINQTRKLVELQKKRKKGLMQQLLLRKNRLASYDSSWQTYTLGNLFKERRETNGIELPLLAITGNRGIIPSSEIIRKDSSNKDKTRYKKILSGDIGYNTMRMWQGVSGVSSLEGIVSPAYTICIPNEVIDAHFIGYFFKFPPIINLFWRYSQGLVADTLNLKFHHFALIKITIPNIKEQKAIAEVLQTADKEINQLERKLNILEKQKRGLMQKLLTGEIRVVT